MHADWQRQNEEEKRRKNRRNWWTGNQYSDTPNLGATSRLQFGYCHEPEVREGSENGATKRATHELVSPLHFSHRPGPGK